MSGPDRPDKRPDQRPDKRPDKRPGDDRKREAREAAIQADIDRAAALLVERYGDAAFVIASATADEAIAARDQQRIATWMLIRAAVRALREKPTKNGPRQDAGARS